MAAHKKGKLDVLAYDLCTNEEKTSKQTIQKDTDWRRRNSINSVRTLLVRKDVEDIQEQVGQEVERESSQKKGKV